MVRTVKTNCASCLLLACCSQYCSLRNFVSVPVNTDASMVLMKVTGNSALSSTPTALHASRDAFGFGRRDNWSSAASAMREAKMCVKWTKSFLLLSIWEVGRILKPVDPSKSTWSVRPAKLNVSTTLIETARIVLTMPGDLSLVMGRGHGHKRKAILTQNSDRLTVHHGHGTQAFSKIPFNSVRCA